MAGKQFRNAGALVALAVGLATAALPAAANAQDGERHGGWQHNGGGNSGRGERGGDGANNGGGWQQRQQAPQVQQQPAPQVQQPPRMERNPAPSSDWRTPGREGPRGDGQRAEGPRAGRDWNNGGAGDRPEGAWRNRPVEQAPPVPPQVQREERQRTYADVWRNRGYQSRQQGWNGSYERNHGGDRRWEGNRTGGNWNRDWRRDNRYNWSSWRNSHRDVYRIGRYYSPYRDWSYRRLGIGFFLQPLFFSQDYWIDDPWMYRLPEAYGPYRWVRYYDDALLVNIYNGEVADVIYDFFW